MCNNNLCPKCKEYYNNNVECKYKKLLEKYKEYYNNNKVSIISKNLEYYENNKVKKLEQMKDYRERNKESLKESLNKKELCECGGRYTVRNKSTHMKSKKHNDYITKKNNISIKNLF